MALTLIPNGMRPADINLVKCSSMSSQLRDAVVRRHCRPAGSFRLSVGELANSPVEELGAERGDVDDRWVGRFLEQGNELDRELYSQTKTWSDEG